MTTAAVVLLSLHLAATAVMTGLIWFVQVVHYPLFAAVGAEQFVAYEVAHQRRTSFVVGLPMLVEGLTVLASTTVSSTPPMKGSILPTPSGGQKNSASTR